MRSIRSCTDACPRLLRKCGRRRNSRIGFPDDVYPKLLDFWATDPGFLKRSKAGKQNRAKGPELTHAHGSKSAKQFEAEFREKYNKEHGRDPDAVTVIEAMKKKKGGAILPGWEQTLAELNERHTHNLGPARENWPTVPTPQNWIPPKKGRVAGQGNIPAQVFGFAPPRRRTTGIHISVRAPELTPEEQLEKEKEKTMNELIRKQLELISPEFAEQSRRAMEEVEARWRGRGVGSSTQNPDPNDAGRRIEDLYHALDEDAREEEMEDPNIYFATEDPCQRQQPGGGDGDGTPDLGDNS